MKSPENTHFHLEYSDHSDAIRIEQELLKALRGKLEQADNQQFVLTVKSDQGILLGGLTASTSYNWLLIKTLWVDESQRRLGVGKALMDMAETRGQEIGCHSAWLDTSNPAAKQFYDKLGYAVFGQLENQPGQIPETHNRWFMKKALSKPQRQHGQPRSRVN